MSLPAAKTSSSSGRTEVAGYDCSYTKPSPSTMAAAGYQFVVGYVSPTSGKNLSAAQVSAARSAGLAVGLVYESTAGRALSGSAAGASDGASAESQANAVGYPTDAVIFFAVDQDTTSANYPAIQAYADAFNGGTQRPVGIYGEADVVDHFVGTASVQYGWQTAAWSGGRLSAKAALYQRVGHPYWPVPSGVASTAFDEDVALHDVPLMGWQGATPPPPPPPGGTYPDVFAWYLPAGHYYGVNNGTSLAHYGGTNADDVWHVERVQRWLVWWGCAAGVPGYDWQTTTWADGQFGQATANAMSLWHSLHYTGRQYPTRCYADDYARLTAP